MGGNAFEFAERLSATQYDLICEAIRNELAHVGCENGSDFVIPESVREKESYGDVDILICGYAIQHARDSLAKEMNLEGEIKNPSGYNLLLNFYGKLVQVDLNKCSEKDFNFAREYFSWNDLGNLIGRIAHRQGLKFGHDGLWYIHREGDKLLGEIKLTDDYHEALSYLGFDVDQYDRGFDTFEQMFNWVKNSSNFEACAYPLEHRNHAARMRDKKRKTYQNFLKWLDFQAEYEESDKAAWLERHKLYWKELGPAIATLDENNELDKLFKTKVNGLIVRDLTGVDGKELGELMRIVRELLPKEKAISYSSLAIEKGIMFAYQIYKEGK